MLCPSSFGCVLSIARIILVLFLFNPSVPLHSPCTLCTFQSSTISSISPRVISKFTRTLYERSSISCVPSNIIIAWRCCLVKSGFVERRLFLSLVCVQPVSLSVKVSATLVDSPSIWYVNRSLSFIEFVPVFNAGQVENTGMGRGEGVVMTRPSHLAQNWLSHRYMKVIKHDTCGWIIQQNRILRIKFRSSSKTFRAKMSTTTLAQFRTNGTHFTSVAVYSFFEKCYRTKLFATMPEGVMGNGVPGTWLRLSVLQRHIGKKHKQLYFCLLCSCW